MNPAEGSEVRDAACDTADEFVDRMNGTDEALVRPPSLAGDVRLAYVAAFCAELMAREGITLKRLRSAMAVVLVLIFVSTAGAADWKVDDSGPWWSISESRHGEHFASGAVIGAAGYCATAALGVPDRLPRYAVAVGAGAVIGLGYEIEHGSDTTVIDPADAAFVAAGALLGALVADVTDQVCELSVGPQWAAVGCRWRW